MAVKLHFNDQFTSLFSPSHMHLIIYLPHAHLQEIVKHCASLIMYFNCQGMLVELHLNNLSGLFSMTMSQVIELFS